MALFLDHRQDDGARPKREQSMTLFTITHTCGHGGQIDIKDRNLNSTRRQERADWIARTKKCPDCIAAERAAENQADAEAASDAGFPALTGSEKQIAWAETIRRDFMGAAETALTNALADAEGGKIPVDVGRLRHAIPLARERMLANTRAGWWIDERKMSVAGRVGQALRQAYDALGA